VTGPAPGPPAAPAMRQHLEQLDRIDQSYWWHRVRWRAVRSTLRRFARGAAFDCYFDVGSGGGGLPGLLVRDIRVGQVLLFDQHAVHPSKIDHPRVTQRFVDLEAFRPEGLPAPDLVTCLDTLEHLRDPGQLLRALRQLAGGRHALLIVTVPALASLWSSWDELAGHHRRYRRAELEALLRQAGWEVLECRYFFHAAVLPLWLQRRAGPGPQRLQFPSLPRWLNRLIEGIFWAEYLATAWCRLPFGSSLIAAAR